MASNSKNLAELLNSDVTLTATDIANGAVTTDKLAADAVTTAKIASSVNLGRRNLIINGALQVAQRGTSSSNDGVQTVDRFNGAAGAWSGWAFTQEQSSDSPDGFSNSLKLTTTTVEPSFDAADLLYMSQEIEAQNLQHLKYGTSSAETCTLSFWVKSSITGVFGISLYQYDNGPHILTPTYTINAANTWEYKTVTIVGNTSGSIDNDNGNGIRVSFIIAAGSDYNDGTSRTSWESYAANKFASGHVQNGIITTLNATFQITGVQLEVSDTATPFEHRSYGEELSLCQRYYEVGDHYSYITTDSAGSTNPDAIFQTTFKVQKRATPTMTKTNYTAIGSATSADPQTITVHGFKQATNINSGVAGGHQYDWQAAAEF